MNADVCEQFVAFNPFLSIYTIPSWPHPFPVTGSRLEVDERANMGMSGFHYNLNYCWISECDLYHWVCVWKVPPVIFQAAKGGANTWTGGAHQLREKSFRGWEPQGWKSSTFAVTRFSDLLHLNAFGKHRVQMIGEKVHYEQVEFFFSFYTEKNVL